MPCPKCGSSNLEELDADFSNPDYHIERYICEDCNTIFKWESSRTIEEEGEEKEDEFNKRLKEIQEIRKQQELQETEEEEEYR